VIGHVIGNYRVVSELGRGGMGLVYLAEHVQLGRQAALKMLLPQFSSDEHIVQRFFNEARAASAIDHPGIVEVYDFGTHTDGRAYIVMALLKGESLQSRLGRGSVSPLEGATLIAQVASALAAAHARGIVHRDLKPDNIFLVPNELMPGGVQVKLLDFGIAKLAGDQAAEHKTQTGVMIGTPAYMSPEQCMGRSDLDHRTDLYSLGCILFHVLCGRPPFTSEQGTGVMIAAHLRDPAPDPRTLNPYIPEALAAIIVRLLEKDPAARFQSALEVRDALIGAGANAPLTRPHAAAAGVPYEPTMAGSPSRPGARHTGPDAYGATIGPGSGVLGHAPTTASGSAAQVVPAPVLAPAASRQRGPLIAVALVGAVAAGIAVFVAVGTGKPARDTTPPAQDTTPPAQRTQPAAARASIEGPPPAAAGAKPAVGDGSATTPAAGEAIARAALTAPTQPDLDCPDGQLTSPDTAGHCCWPDQAWSSTKGRCVGAPRCPPGMTVAREQCVAAAKPIPRDPSAKPVTTFSLAAQTVEPGAPIEIAFPAPVPSPSSNRAWVTVVEASKPASAYATWVFVEDGARTAKLVAPKTPGSYEVRLHTDYPAHATFLRHAVPLTVRGVELAAEADAPPSETPRAQQRFSVASQTVPGGGQATLRFPVPLVAARGERFWITVIDADAPDSKYGTWAYVAAGAREATLAVPSTAGEYELRLHANYPRLGTNVVHRVRIRVD